MNAEDVLTRFLESWQHRTWDKMARYVQLTWLKNHTPDLVSPLSYLFGSLYLDRYQIGQRTKHSLVMSDFTVMVKLRVMSDDIIIAAFEQDISCRLIREKAPYQPSELGIWGVNPISVWRTVYLNQRKE